MTPPEATETPETPETAESLASRRVIETLLRPDLVGGSAYGAPQLEVPVALNTNENSYPVPEAAVAAIRDGIAAMGEALIRSAMAPSPPASPQTT